MVLPLLVAVRIGLVWLLAVGAAQVRAVDAARETARALARGDEQATAVGRGLAVAPDGSQVAVSRSSGAGPGHRDRPGRGPGGLFAHLPAPRLRAEAVAADEDGDGPVTGVRPGHRLGGAGARLGDPLRGGRDRRCWSWSAPPSAWSARCSTPTGSPSPPPTSRRWPAPRPAAQGRDPCAAADDDRRRQRRPPRHLHRRRVRRPAPGHRRRARTGSASATTWSRSPGPAQGGAAGRAPRVSGQGERPG